MWYNVDVEAEAYGLLKVSVPHKRARQPQHLTPTVRDLPYLMQNKEEEKYLRRICPICGGLEYWGYSYEHMDCINEETRRNHVVTPLERARKRFDKKRNRIFKQLIERDGKYCAHCGRTDDLTVDHIIPISNNGDDELDNLQILCRACNSSKKDR